MIVDVNRLGTGADLKLLPPPDVGRWRLYERMALQVRKFAGVDLKGRLDPFALATLVNVRVVYLDDLINLSESSRVRLDVPDGWSGGARQDLGDGSYVVVLSQQHSSGRRAATLMEEKWHIPLSHQSCKISADRIGGRSYNFNVEEEAYAVGAAPLVPYHSLKSLLVSGASVRKIAGFFGVTPSLILYRARGTQLGRFLT